MTRVRDWIARHRSAGLFAVALGTIAAFPTHWDDQVLDQQFRWLRALREVPVVPDVTIVGIDDQTYASLREPFTLWHPHFGKLFSAMARLKPSVLAVDITLPEHTYDFIVPGYDRALLMGLRDLRLAKLPMVLGQALIEGGRIRRVIAPAIAIAGEDSFAAIYLRPDADGALRRVGPFLDAGGGGAAATMPVLSSKAAADLGYTPREGLINYAIGAPMEYVPMQDVLGWADRGELEEHAALFRGRPVFVGPIEPFVDRHPAAVNLNAADIRMQAQARIEGKRYAVRVPGVMVHAQILRSYLSGAVVQRLNWGWLLALHLLACCAWWLRRGWPRAVFVIAFPVVVLAGATLALHANVFVPVVGILLFGVLGLGARVASESYDLFRERQRLRHVFGSSVSPSVLKGILSGRIVPDQAGKDAELCVLSADIRGYTRRCQTIAPAEAVRLLNRYFEEMVEAIHDHDGTVDKFIGDGLLAFFGEPRVDGAPDPCAQALAAAAGMRERLGVINRELIAAGDDPLRIGVGLDFGHVVVGYVGSKRKHEYTVIGDTVNMAARIESLSKKVFNATAPAFSCLCSGKVFERLDAQQRELLQDCGAHVMDGGREVRTYGYAA